MTQAIHWKMLLILAGMDAIAKDSENKQQGFKYRGIDAVYNALNPLLTKHGVFMTAQVMGKSREERASKTGGVLAFTSLHMKYRFWAEDGSYVETEAEGEGMDSGDKSSNKAMAVAHKYAILQAFCIPTKDMDDPDAQTHEIAAPEGVTAPPATDSKALANQWGKVTEAKLPTMNVGEFREWDADPKNKVRLGRLRNYNEAQHKRISDLVLKRSLELSASITKNGAPNGH